jgi:hypothetical protein
MNNASISGVGRVLRRPWYAFWHVIEKLAYQGREYTLQVPSGHRVYTPWFWKHADHDFSRLMDLVCRAGPLSVSPDRCYVLYQFCRHCLHLDGDVAECGVYTGGTGHLLSLTLSARPKPLHLFDTFCGMPNVSVPRRDYHFPGDFSDTSLDLVKRRLKDFHFVMFHPGIMPATFDEVRTVRSYSFVHVDVDIYPSVLECCRWFWPRLSPGGVMVFDDYGFYPYRHAARAAVDEFCVSLWERPIALPTGQAVLLKV